MKAEAPFIVKYVNKILRLTIPTNGMRQKRPRLGTFIELNGRVETRHMYHTNLIYHLKSVDDDNYIALNREYKPIGLISSAITDIQGFVYEDAKYAYIPKNLVDMNALENPDGWFYSEDSLPWSSYDNLIKYSQEFQKVFDKCY
jgi:hypothetical protein